MDNQYLEKVASILKLPAPKSMGGIVRSAKSMTSKFGFQATATTPLLKRIKDSLH